MNCRTVALLSATMMCACGLQFVLVATTLSAATMNRIEMRLIPSETHVAVGDPLVLQLEFTNVGHEASRLWMAPARRVQGWNLRLKLNGPNGKRVLVPAISHQGLYLPADSDVVALPPGGRGVAILALRGGEHLPDLVGRRLYSDWDCYRLDEYAEGLRTGAWSVPGLDTCLNSPGAYDFSAELDFSGLGGLELGTQRPALFVGKLGAPTVRVVLTKPGR